MSLVDDRLKQVRLKCRQLSESQTSTESCLNDDTYNEVTVLMKYCDEMNKTKDKCKIKLKKTIEKHQNLYKELNIRRQENTILEKYISDVKSHIKTVDDVKRENHYFQLFKEKNITKISQLKEETARISNFSFNISKQILLDSDDDFMGFDSVTESYTSAQKESNRNLYNNIKKTSDNFQYSVDSLLNIMKKTNLSIQTAIENIDSFTSQVPHDIKSAQKQFTKVLRNDQEAKNELIKKRGILERIKLKSFSHLSSLESDIELLENRVKTKHVPTQNLYDNFCSRHLKKLSIQQLFLIWSEMILSWQPNDKTFENCAIEKLME